MVPLVALADHLDPDVALAGPLVVVLAGTDLLTDVVLVPQVILRRHLRVFAGPNFANYLVTWTLPNSSF